MGRAAGDDEGVAFAKGESGCADGFGAAPLAGGDHVSTLWCSADFVFGGAFEDLKDVVAVGVGFKAGGGFVLLSGEDHGEGCVYFFDEVDVAGVGQGLSDVIFHLLGGDVLEGRGMGWHAAGAPVASRASGCGGVHGCGGEGDSSGGCDGCGAEEFAAGGGLDIGWGHGFPPEALSEKSRTLRGWVCQPIKGGDRTGMWDGVCGMRVGWRGQTFMLLCYGWRES